MKKIFALILIAGMIAFFACGPSEKEKKEKAEKAKQDSIARADSLKAVLLIEKMKQDSILAVEKSNKEIDSIANLIISQAQKQRLDKSVVLDLVATYKSILRSKDKLFKLIGSKPIGKYNADGLDLTQGGTELSGKYNKFLSLSQVVQLAGDFCPQKQIDEYNSLLNELTKKGVIAIIKEIQNGQAKLKSKLNGIDKK